MHIPLSFFLWCAVSGLLGILLQILIKMNSLKSKSKSANLKFSAKEFFADDWITIMISVLVVVVCIVLLDEILRFKPSIQAWIKFGFFFVGYTGSSILLYALGKTESKIMAIIDAKTNVSDTVTGGTSSVAETLRKGEIATGQEIKAPLPESNRNSEP